MQRNMKSKIGTDNKVGFGTKEIIETREKQFQNSSQQDVSTARGEKQQTRNNATQVPIRNLYSCL